MLKEEYEAKYQKNTTMSGHGFEASVHMACPFCAEPGFCTYRILDAKEVLAQEHVCKYCGRGIKAIFRGWQGQDGYMMEFIQTQGPDVTEDYLKWIRREV